MKVLRAGFMLPVATAALMAGFRPPTPRVRVAKTEEPTIKVPVEVDPNATTAEKKIAKTLADQNKVRIKAAQAKRKRKMKRNKALAKNGAMK